MFCRASGSVTLSEPTTLGALWAANPKLEVVSGLGDAATRALDLVLITRGGPTARALIVGEVARGLAADETGAGAELAARLTDYPGAANGLVVSNASPRASRDGQPQVEIGWRDPSGTPIDVGQIAPGYGMLNSGAFLRPALNSAGDVLEPLPLWWATLLALSSIARYHPESVDRGARA